MKREFTTEMIEELIRYHSIQADKHKREVKNYKRLFQEYGVNIPQWRVDCDRREKLMEIEEATTSILQRYLNVLKDGEI